MRHRRFLVDAVLQVVVNSLRVRCTSVLNSNDHTLIGHRKRTRFNRLSIHREKFLIIQTAT